MGVLKNTLIESARECNNRLYLQQKLMAIESLKHSILQLCSVLVYRRHTIWLSIWWNYVKFVLTGSIVNLLSNIRARMIRFHTSIVKAEVVTISKLFVLERNGNNGAGVLIITNKSMPLKVLHSYRNILIGLWQFQDERLVLVETINDSGRVWWYGSCKT